MLERYNDPRRRICRRIALEMRDGCFVNLGIGIPTGVTAELPEGVDVILQSENGFTHMGPAPDGIIDKDILNAGGSPVTIKRGGAFFDSAASFTLIRGGHIDIAVIGALEVDAKGCIASWLIPGKKMPGMGGAMDLVTGAKRLIIAMMHTVNGVSKILDDCQLPITGKGVDMIVTELAVFHLVPEGLLLTEVCQGYTVEDVLATTNAKVIVSDNVGVMKL